MEQHRVVCVAASHGQRFTQEEVARGIAQLSSLPRAALSTALSTALRTAGVPSVAIKVLLVGEGRAWLGVRVA